MFAYPVLVTRKEEHTNTSHFYTDFSKTGVRKDGTTIIFVQMNGTNAFIDSTRHHQQGVDDTYNYISSGSENRKRIKKRKVLIHISL